MLERAVVNAGPLVALSLVGRLDLLPALFKEFCIPETVFREVALAGLGRPGAAALADEPWAKRVRISPEPDPLLVVELDAGEASVISLARVCPPCMAIIDEKRGRRIAHHVYGLPVKGTPGLLAEARRRGLLSDLRATLGDLRQSGYYLSDAVIEGACRAGGEA
jgi:predicted nucleic acid-binding protein